MKTATIRIKDLYAKIVSPKSTEGVKTGAESDVNESQGHISALGGMSSLLDLLSSPLAVLVKDTIPLAPVSIAILQQFKHELTLEECVVFVAQVAYLESWEEEVQEKLDWWHKVIYDRPSPKFEQKLLDLGEMEIDRSAALTILDRLLSSDLMVRFNDILSLRLQELGLDEADARIVVLRVAGNTPRYFHRILADNVDNVKVLGEFYKARSMEVNRDIQIDIAPCLDFSDNGFGELAIAEELKEAMIDWSSSIVTRKGIEDQIDRQQLEWQIYDLLGAGCLRREIVDRLWVMLVDNDDWQPIRLFDRLNEFWESWCDGVFIDREPSDNLPQKKMRLLREQMPDCDDFFGVRQVDVYTGLNILILLSKLNSYARQKDELKDEIGFYPNGKPGHEDFDRLRKAIYYGESIESDIFSNVRCYLDYANLSGANLSNTNLSDANLSDANLDNANLSNTNLSGANLTNAHLWDLNISGANISGANLKTIEWNIKKTNWHQANGLKTAFNLPAKLEQYLGFP
jgi:hypothetical protein